MNLSALRLHHQHISMPQSGSIAEVVQHLVALQAQDYSGAKWSLGLRLRGIMESDIDVAIREKHLVRTWPMRGTLHFVAPSDVRWMLKLLTPRIIAGMATINRQKELDETVFSRSKDILIEALEGNKELTRSELYSILQNQGIATDAQRGVHILNRAAMDGLICLGPHLDKQATFVLLDEWLPAFEDIDLKEALSRLAFRYFNSHGPATLQDFVWWSGLKISDARTGLAMVSSRLVQFHAHGQDYFMSPNTDPVSSPSMTSHLLPGFDEYILGYTDRSHAVSPEFAGKLVPGRNGVFMPTLICEGKAVGIWKKILKKEAVTIAIDLFDPLNKIDRQQIQQAAERHCAYLGKTLSEIVYNG